MTPPLRPIGHTLTGLPILPAPRAPKGEPQPMGLTLSGDPIWAARPGAVPPGQPQPLGVLSNGQLVFGTMTTTARPLWRRKRVLIPVGVVVLFVAVGLAAPDPAPDREPLQSFTASASDDTRRDAEAAERAAKAAAEQVADAADKEAADAADKEAADAAAKDASDAAAKQAAEVAAAQQAADAAAKQAAEAAAKQVAEAAAAQQAADVAAKQAADAAAKQAADAAAARPAAAAPAPPAPVGAERFKNCDAMHQKYPHGVGRPGAQDKTSGTPVTTFTPSEALYNANTGSDRDKDGIACEQK